MSGQAGVRGYLLQALICVLDCLDETHDWSAVAIEPHDEAEKIDILWEYPGFRKVVQVKSSKNQINLASVRSWAEDLEASATADEYELRLIGPCSQAVCETRSHGRVWVPVPQSLDIKALSQQAAHRLDGFLTRIGNTHRPSPVVREILVDAMSNRLGLLSTTGETISRADFEVMVKLWVREIQPKLTSPVDSRVQSGMARQIRNPPREFVGHRIELREAESYIRSGSRLVGVRGMPGVGKTAFSLKLASAVGELFPDAQFQLDMHGQTTRPLSPIDAKRLVIRTTMPDAMLPEVDSEIEALYQTIMHGKRSMLFVDNVPDADSVASLDPGNDSLLLFATRRRFSLPGLLSVDLGPLECAFAIELLQKLCPRISHEARRIADLCGYLPLALRVCACAIAERPDIGVADHVEELVGKRSFLGYVEAAIALSYDLLEREVQERFHLLSLFSSHFDRSAAAAVWDTEDEAAGVTLGTLLLHSVVEWDQTVERYWMHDLLAQFAGECLGDSCLSEAMWRFCRHFADKCLALEQQYETGSDSATEALMGFDVDRPNIEIAFEWVVHRLGDAHEAVQLCIDYVARAAQIRDMRQHPLERIRWCRVGLEAARKAGDFHASVQFLGNGARAHAELGDLQGARSIHEEVLSMARKSGHGQHECTALIQLGNMELESESFDVAKQRFEDAARVAAAIEEPSLGAAAAANLAQVLIQLGDIDSAKKHLAIACDAFAMLGDQRGILTPLALMAKIAAIGEDYQLATEILENAIGIAEELRDPVNMLRLRCELGRVKLSSGNFDDAVCILEKNVEFGRSVGLVKYVLQSLSFLVQAYESAKLPAKCDCALRELEEVGMKIGGDAVEASTRRLRTEILRMRGRHGEAIALCRESLACDRKDGSLDRELITLLKLFQLCEELGDIEQAIEILDRAVQIGREIGVPVVESMSSTLRRLREGQC
ncbi:Regulatory protein AfsR [Planctomycetes bacterium Pan216]|uniref:Regulatory protein AfsR n=1 Tax=Kolteria novifilia TaxID=2527975 RepID=A0A518AYS1_9BACT|nr:Regulatory protein AfsR [Planctomycetes bacterium Pan216]